MKTKYLLIFLVVLFFANIVFCNETDKKSLKFIENKGQWVNNVLFKTNIKTGSAFIEKDGIVFNLSDRNKGCSHDHKSESNSCESKKIINNHAFKLRLINSNNNSIISPKNESKEYYNFFIGNDKSKWASNIKAYSEITYNQIYNNIDWKIYSQEGNIKHDFIVKKGGKVEDISLEYIGLNDIYIKKHNLVLCTSIGEIIELRPMVYQIINEEKIVIDAKFILDGSIIKYQIDQYNKDYELIIDPMLIFSTYTGSTADNWGFTATYDRKGNAYCGGIVFDNGYPTTLGAYQTNYIGGSCDISISKFDKNGNLLLYSTYLGSTSSEMPHSLIVNELDELVIFGTTGGKDFPTTKAAYQRVFKGGDTVYYDNMIKYINGCDIFVSKLNNLGTGILASTYVGGTDNDGLNYLERYNKVPNIEMYGNDSLYSNYGDGARGELITDDKNNIYIGTCTYSSDFPTTISSFQAHHGGKQDGVVFKLDYSLSKMLFSSYIGGSEDDAVFSIDTDKESKLYVTGGTVSHNFPTTLDAFSPNHNGGSTDAFVSLISYNGSTLIASTFFGSNTIDNAFFVRTDKYNYPHIFGQTKASGSTLVYNALYSAPNSGQFIAKFSPDLKSRVWSTVWGSGNGKKNISPTAFSVDICGRIYASGWGGFGELSTINLDITNDAYQKKTDGGDFYIMTINPNSPLLDYGTYFGEYIGRSSDHVDGGTSRFDKYGTLYQTVCASCGSTDSFPTTTNAYSNVNNSSNCNAAIYKFNVHSDFAVADFDYPLIECAPASISFVNNSRGTNYLWDFGDGNTSTQINPTHTFTKGGIYQIKLISYLNGGCNSSDTATRTLIVLGDSTRYLPDVYTCPDVPIQVGIQQLQQSNLVVKWIPSNAVTNDSITNPYAIVSNNTELMLIISNGICTDTLIQKVFISPIPITLDDSITTCNSPYFLSLDSDVFPLINFYLDGNLRYIINKDTISNTVSFDLNNSKYIYYRVAKDGCNYIDSIWFNFTGSVLDLETKNVRCAGEANGYATVNISGGHTPYNILWSNGSSSNSINNLDKGNYQLTVTDSLGCVSKVFFSIISPDTLKINPSHINNNCDIACQGSIFINPSGGYKPYDIAWSNGSNQLNLYGLCNGYYRVEISDTMGCKISDSIYISNLDLFSDFWVMASAVEIYDGQVITLSSKQIPNMLYQWVPTSVYSPNSPITKARPLTTTTYTAYVTDEKGCNAQDSVTIKVNVVICDKPNIFIPNIFTPNNDGKNDVIKVSGEYVRSINFCIFDRWGEMVFSTKDINEGWDGKFRGKDCIPGVYFYRLEVECEAERKYASSGDITLIR